MLPSKSGYGAGVNSHDGGHFICRVTSSEERDDIGFLCRRDWVHGELQVLLWCIWHMFSIVNIVT